MADFEQTYVATNNKPGAPAYDPEFLLQLQARLCNEAPELNPISYPVMAALCVGAHRPDIVPKLFEASIERVTAVTSIKASFEEFRSMLMIVWPFVGIPWCVPACFGLVNVLKSKGMEHLAEGRTRPEISAHDKEEGHQLLLKTYNGVQNSEVRDMLRTYFADFSSLTWTVVFGYSLAGTTATGIFKDFQTQLLLASAIAASGATRQARSHAKAAIGMGNSTDAVRVVYKVARELNGWNGSHIAVIDVDELAMELSIALTSEADGA